MEMQGVEVNADVLPSAHSGHFMYDCIERKMFELDTMSSHSIRQKGTIMVPPPGSVYDPEYPGANHMGYLTIDQMEFLISEGKYETREAAKTREPSKTTEHRELTCEEKELLYQLNPRPTDTKLMHIFKYNIKTQYLPLLIVQVEGALLQENMNYSIDQLIQALFRPCADYTTTKGGKLNVVVDLKMAVFLDIVIAQNIIAFFMRPDIAVNFRKVCVLRPKVETGKEVRDLLQFLAVICAADSVADGPSFRIVDHNREVDAFVNAN